MSILSAFNDGFTSTTEYHRKQSAILSDGNTRNQLAFALSASLIGLGLDPLQRDETVTVTTWGNRMRASLCIPVPYEKLIETDFNGGFNIHQNYNGYWQAEGVVQRESDTYLCSIALRAQVPDCDIELLKRIGRLKASPVATIGGGFTLTC